MVTEGLVALADWVQAGGHLLTTAGAAAYDRYHRPSKVLSAVTGFVEAPHERLMVQWSALLKVAATGVGELGAIEAYGVRSNLKSFGARDFQQLAAFADGTPAIARNSAVGKGSATHFAFHPSLRFPNMNRTIRNAASRPARARSSAPRSSSTAAFPAALLKIQACMAA